MDWIKSIWTMVIGNEIVLGALAAAIVLIVIVIISIFNTKSRRLQRAVQRGSVHRTQKLISKGANVNAETPIGTSLLSMAVGRTHNTELVKTLLEAGANAKDGEALIVAANDGQIEMMHMLIDADADINAESKFDNMSALATASYRGQVDAVKLLLKYGARVNNGNMFGKDPLQQAISNEGKWDPHKRKKNIEIVNLLIETGAFVNGIMGGIPTSFLDTIVAGAAEQQVDSQLSFYLLTLLAHHGHYHVIAKILRDNEVQSYDAIYGSFPVETLLEYAQKMEFNEIADILLQKGAVVIEDTPEFKAKMDRTIENAKKNGQGSRYHF